MLPGLMGGPLVTGGPSYTAEAQAVFDAFSTAPTATRKAQIDAAIRHMKDGPYSGSDVWAKLDMLQVYKAADSQAATVDWADPSRSATLVNSPTFTADSRITTNGTNSEIDTGFNPGDGGSYSFLRNSASFGFWQHGSGGTTGSVAGWFDGSDGITLQTRNTADAFGFRVNQAAGTTGGETDGAYLGIANRSGASATEWYKSGLSNDSAINVNPDRASTAVNNNSLRVGRITTSGYTAVGAVLTFAGGSLSEDEVADMHNALAGYVTGVDASLVVRADAVAVHGVRNAWDSENRHFVIVGNNALYVSHDAGQSYSLLYTFPDSPTVTYGLFISSDDYIFVSPQGQSTGINGRVYRSTDNGATFSEISTFDAGWHSGHIAFWGMTEDSGGNLYCGQYNTFPTKETKCRVWKSTDAGANWTDISDASWSTTDHVHDVAIDPVNGWLYATIGDSTAGVWRSKLKDGTDWVRKTTSSTYKYIPLAFDGTYIYVGDDEADGTVARFQDDGTATTVAPTTVLTSGYLHNCYYLARDPSGRFWACFPPADATTPNVVGSVHVSDDGATWTKVYQAPSEAYASWNNGASSTWTLHTGTTQWGTRTNANLFPLKGSKAVRLTVK